MSAIHSTIFKLPTQIQVFQLKSIKIIIYHFNNKNNCIVLISFFDAVFNCEGDSDHIGALTAIWSEFFFTTTELRVCVWIVSFYAHCNFVKCKWVDQWIIETKRTLGSNDARKHWRCVDYVFVWLRYRCAIHTIQYRPAAIYHTLAVSAELAINQYILIFQTKQKHISRTLFFVKHSDTTRYFYQKQLSPN